ncbi:hypothetical protein ACQ4PT_042772 [Festuca glaucescens]
MRAISKFSLSGRLPYLSAEAILEMLDFANKFCCRGLKDACERKLASFVSSRQDAIDFMECAVELGCSILAASCLQVLLNELPECLNDEQVVRIFSSANKQQRSTMAGNASFSLYCLLSEVSMSISATSDVTISFLEKLVDSASDSRQKQLSLHQLACMRLLRKDHTEAERLFNAAFTAGHLYSAILTLAPDYRMIGGRVAAKQLRMLVMENVEQWTTADCWMQLYDRWSSVDDIGSLSVIYQMLESDAAKGVLYFRQSLLLLRLNCPEAAMRSLQLAREHAASQHERLVYEGWILYDTGHCEEGLQKAEASIAIQRSFEAFFLKAYALADSSLEPSTSATVVSLLEDALRCPSDRLRKGQALNNLGSVYVDCGKLDLAAECYINALKIGHTRAHQGLARVHFLRNNRTVLMDNHKEKDAISELTKAIAFKADLNLLHLRAAFHEHVGDISGAPPGLPCSALGGPQPPGDAGASPPGEQPRTLSPLLYIQERLP